MYCKECKFWTRDKAWNFEKHRKESSLSEVMGECSCPKFFYDQWCDGGLSDGLAYWDSESYAASFKTGQDFGCIHFETAI